METSFHMEAARYQNEQDTRRWKKQRHRRRRRRRRRRDGGGRDGGRIGSNRREAGELEEGESEARQGQQVLCHRASKSGQFWCASAQHLASLARPSTRARFCTDDVIEI